MSAANPAGRSLAIDAFRALTVLLMITVNEWSGVAGLPVWMKHYPADADAMSFVDMVFPAFLFIVGMSIPLALGAREAAGESRGQIIRHVLMRSLGLLVLGVFMVNAESGFAAQAMPLPIAAWALLAYACAFLVWGSLRGGPPLAWPWRLLGVLGLLALALVYRDGESGQLGLRPQWWGILGLIGWAYLLACLVHLLCRDRPASLLLALGLGLLYALAARHPGLNQQPGLALLLGGGGHVVHALIVVCGMLCAALSRGPSRQVWGQALALAAGLALLAALLRPLHGISKIYATPSWALFSAAACVLIHALLQELIDRRGLRGWTRWLQPAAAHPLLAYLLPFVIAALLQLLQLSMPALLRSTLPGLLWGPLYALLMLGLVWQLSARGLRLRL